MTDPALENKTVVVIGASSGIGLATTELCARLGARVWMASRSAEKLAVAREGLTGKVAADRLETRPVDLLEEDSVRALFERVGRLDHLVVTAVADENKLHSPLATMSLEVARRGMEKFWGAFLAVREAAPRLNPGGSIVLTSSVSIFRPSRDGGVSVMSAASGAVAAFGRTLAAELAPIRVNVIAPGVVETGVWGEKGAGELAELKRWAAESLPVRHLGQPGELAQAVVSLLTNPYLTGVILPVDGGLSIS